MIEKAEYLDICNLFDKSYYKIPEYQREYSWRLENWENLYNDIIDSDNEGYFLGTIICISNDKEMQVVDGQQRLTTLSIFRLAVHKYLQERQNDFATPIDGNHKLTAYQNLSSTIKDENNINRLELQGLNKDEYKTLLIDPNNNRIDKRKRIKKAYDYFYSKMIEENPDGKVNMNIDDIFNLLKK